MTTSRLSSAGVPPACVAAASHRRFRPEKITPRHERGSHCQASHMPLSLRGAQRRSNPCWIATPSFLGLAMTSKRVNCPVQVLLCDKHARTGWFRLAPRGSVCRIWPLASGIRTTSRPRESRDNGRVGDQANSRIKTRALSTITRASLFVADAPIVSPVELGAAPFNSIPTARVPSTSTSSV